MVVKFRLHDGKVPYFIKEVLYTNLTNDKGEYIGVLKETTDYIPNTLVEPSAEEVTWFEENEQIQLEKMKYLLSL